MTLQVLLKPAHQQKISPALMTFLLHLLINVRLKINYMLSRSKNFLQQLLSVIQYSLFLQISIEPSQLHAVVNQHTSLVIFQLEKNQTTPSYELTFITSRIVPVSSMKCPFSNRFMLLENFRFRSQQYKSIVLDRYTYCTSSSILFRIHLGIKA